MEHSGKVALSLSKIKIITVEICALLLKKKKSSISSSLHSESERRLMMTADVVVICGVTGRGRGRFRGC